MQYPCLDSIWRYRLRPAITAGWFAAIALGGCLETPAFATTPTVAIIVLSADRIAFYNDRFVIRADGKVRVDLGTRTIIRGESFVMDLRASRFVVAGDVHVEGRATLNAVALADDLANDRAYSLRLGANGPLRSTYAHSDFSGLTVNDDPPGDVFALPDVARLPASFLARSVTIGAGSYLRFSGCRAQILGGFKAAIPLPGCYVNFGSDPNLAQNSLSGANIGAGYRFTGSANAISAVIFNYDSVNRFYGAVQENISSKNAWAVASINPIGKRDLVYSAIGAVQSEHSTGLRVSGQYHTATMTDLQPYGSYSYTDALVTQGLPGASVQIFASSQNQTVADGAALSPNKASHVQFSLDSSDVSIGPMIANVRAGYGLNHDPFGLQTFEGVTYQTIRSDYLGGALRLPHFGIGSVRRADARWFVDAGVDVQRQWHSLPHVIDDVTFTTSLSRSFGKASAYVSYTSANVRDSYGNAQRIAYPVQLPEVDPGYAAFEGFATFRTVAIEGAYTPRADVAATLTLRKHDDFPKPVAAFFASPLPPALGQNPQPYALGAPPYDLTTTVRFRLNPQLTIDVQDVYYFRFGGATRSGVVIQLRP